MHFWRKIKPFFTGLAEETKEQKKCLPLSQSGNATSAATPSSAFRQHDARVDLLARAVSDLILSHIF